MSRHPETNPHFKRPLSRQRDGQQSPEQPGPHYQDQDQENPEFPHQRASRPPKQDQRQKQKAPPPHDKSFGTPRFPTVAAPRLGPHSQPQPHGQFDSPWFMPQSHHQDQGNSPQLPPPVRSPKLQDRHGQGHRQSPKLQDQHGQGHRQSYGPGGAASAPDRRHRREELRAPARRKSKLITWFFAVFCAIFWIVIFLGGLIILIVYLVYRPRMPSFDVSNASLNVAYIDSGPLLNADLTILANFTNPNRKATVDFGSMFLELYYGNTLIATQYVVPFSAERSMSTFRSVHMVTSQVQLPLGESLLLQEQMMRNGVIFVVKGVFRVRSNLGSFLRYSYRLYGHCSIMVTGPPNGILRARNCKTRR